MIIELQETLGSSNLLVDLIDYNDLVKFVMGVYKQETSFHPIDFSIKAGDKTYTILKDDEFVDDEYDVTMELLDLDQELLDFPNDTMHIVCDEFEYELYIEV